MTEPRLFNKASVREAPVAGRRVLVRSDLNAPLERGEVTDDTRIRSAIPTLELLREEGASVVVASHLGRPDGRDPDLSMAPVGRRLAALLDAPVQQAAAVIGDEVRAQAEGLSPGEVLVLENVRFEPGETENDATLAAAFAELGDLFVNDAFGTAHRVHASTVGVARQLPGYAGLLLEREVRELTAVRDQPDPPAVVIFGGAKVEDKIGAIEHFLDSADTVLIGGAMCFSFFRALGHQVSDSLVDDESVELARQILARGDDVLDTLELPVDLVIAERFDVTARRRDIQSRDVPDGWMGLDIGPLTAAAYAEEIANAGTVLWNGPMGAFELEPFASGTRVVAEAVAATGARTVVGGGDSIAALNRFGLADRVDWLSTGGGASLELLAGNPLPGIEALLDSEPARVRQHDV